MTILSLNQKNARVEIKDFEVESPIVFNFFNKAPAAERDQLLLRAINIGVLALMEDRFSAFLAKTSNELGTELESLKMIFDMKQTLFFKTSVKGLMAETEIAEFLVSFLSENRLADQVSLTGNSAGKIPRNKTGDIVCSIDGKDDLGIVIECKFDKSIRLGDIQTKDIFTRKTDTAWSQLLEAQVNRAGKASIIVFDASLADSSILDNVQNIRFIPAIGFVAIVDTQKGDFSNLAIAYMLARDIALKAKPVQFDKDLLSILINRIVRDLAEILKIKTLVLSNIETNKSILQQLEKSMLLMKFNQEYLVRFLDSGLLTKEDLLAFYTGETVSNNFKLIEKEIKEI